MNSKAINSWSWLSALAIMVAIGVLVSTTQRRNQQPEASAFQIKFSDTETGFAVAVNRITVDGSPQAITLVGPGRVMLSIKSGRHRVMIEAVGYRGLSTDISVSSEKNGPVDMLLSPTQPPPEISASATAGRVRSDATAIVGFVSGVDTGQPLSGVIIRTTDGSATQTTTNDRGFFALRVPIDSHHEGSQFTGLAFERGGYISYERQNIRLAVGDVITYRVSLDIGTGTRTVDENSLRRR